MKIHEYQAKELFRKFDVTVPKGRVAFTPAEARAAAQELPGFPVVVKAQIHAGGRGKGGGVKLAQSLAEAESLAEEDPRYDPGDPSDRPGGTPGAQGAHRAGAQHRQGTLPEHPAGPRHGPECHHGQ